MNVSALSAHYTNLTKITNLDLFSCAHYFSQKAVDFDKNFFHAEELRIQDLNKR